MRLRNQLGPNDLHPKKQTVEEHTVENKTYRLERVRCGKEKCKCAAVSLHGPYWYVYWSEGGKTKSQYVGKEPPDQCINRVSRTSK